MYTRHNDSVSWREQYIFGKGYKKSYAGVGAPGTGTTIEIAQPVYYTDKEKETLLKSGKYVPQNHTSKPYNLINFSSAPSSLQNGDRQKGATGHN